MNNSQSPNPNLNQLRVGQTIRCVVGELSPNGYKLTADSDTIQSDFYLSKRSKHDYTKGEVADFWVLYVSDNQSTCLVTDSDFGFLPISDRMRPRYIKSLRSVLAVVEDGSDIDLGDDAWLSDLKGMYSRSYKKDQWDWFVVWSLLGSPPLPTCRFLARTLGEVRKALRSGHSLAMKQLREHAIASQATEWRTALDLLESDAPQLPFQTRRPRTGTTSIKVEPRSFTVNHEKLDRANRLHSETVLSLILRLTQEGYMPHEHDLVDVFCQLKTGPALFEIKSLSAENEDSQIRSAYSQLSYYAFLAAKEHVKFSGASRWLVLSSKPDRADLLDWMDAERINVIWIDGDRFVGTKLPW